MAKGPYISVVVPCYDERDLMQKSHRRLIAVLETLCGRDFEIVYVDDGSTDGTSALLEGLASEDQRIKVIQFTRNFGHQPAIVAGLANSTGDYVAILDSDMQDPPELLAEMLGELKQTGADVVYGVRRKREGESFVRLVLTKLYYRLLRVTTTIAVPLDAGDFRVMTRQVAMSLVELPEKAKYIRGLTVWLGYRHVPFEYDREARSGGYSKYSVVKLILLGSAGLTSFGTRLLVLPPLLATIFLLVTISLAGCEILDIRYSVSMNLIAYLGVAVVYLCLAIWGLFFSRIYVELMGRPMYVVRRKFNCEEFEQE